MPFSPADGVPCELLPDGRLRVTAPVVWTGTKGDAVLIPAGTVTDLASVPRVARGLVDVGGPIGRAAIVHDVLCDAANAWSAAGCPEAQRPRFLGPDIDGALRAAARDLQADAGERWLYWVAVRWGALFGSKGRRVRWLSTVWPVLALTVPAVLVALPAVLGAVVARVLLVVCELLAWPWSGAAPVLREPARVVLVCAPGDPPRQMASGAARLAQAARAVSTMLAPVGPTSGPQRVVHARRVAARQRERGAAPWCAAFLQTCTPSCHPAAGCARAHLQETGRDVEAACAPTCSAFLHGTGVHDRSCPARGAACTCPAELVVSGRPHAPSCPYRPPAVGR